MTWLPDGRGGAESSPYRVSLYAGGGWLAGEHSPGRRARCLPDGPGSAGGVRSSRQPEGRRGMSGLLRMLTLDGQVVGVALVGLAVWLVFSVRAQGEALRALVERMDRFDERLRAVEVAIARLATGGGGGAA